MNSKNILYLIGGMCVLGLVAVGIFSLVAKSPSPVVSNPAGNEGSQNTVPSGSVSDYTAPQPTSSSGAPSPSAATPGSLFWGMKLVNETVTDADLDSMKALGIGVIEGEWGMSDATPKQVLALLDRLQARGMKLIMNFTEESAWGYQGGGDDPATQKPVWQKAQVETYVKALMNHPALYGYDISNEDGENLPNGDTLRMTLAQMKEASATVRAIDPSHPVLMRMHYWDRFDGDFTDRNPFAPGIADIVMLNLYSNWTQDGVKAEIPDMLSLSAQSLVDKVRGVDPNVKVWIALGAFREAPSFLRPTATELAGDIRAALATKGVSNISFFGWGPERYPDQGPGWYLPRDGQDLVDVIRSFTKAH